MDRRIWIYLTVTAQTIGGPWLDPGLDPDIEPTTPDAAPAVKPLGSTAFAIRGEVTANAETYARLPAASH